jgi:hypothetical protein
MCLKLCIEHVCNEKSIESDIKLKEWKEKTTFIVVINPNKD